MKYVALIFIILCCSACEFYDQKKVHAEDLLNEELKTFNWQEVDTYPTFESCGDDLDRMAAKQCFEAQLRTSISNRLSAEGLVVTKAVQDTIFIAFQVSKEGRIYIQDLKIPLQVTEEIPELETLIYQSLEALPTVVPAIKRSQFVTTEFSLPLIISVE